MTFPLHPPFSPLEMKLFMQQNCIESCRIILKAPSAKLRHKILQRYSTDDGDSRGVETYYGDWNCCELRLRNKTELYNNWKLYICEKRLSAKAPYLNFVEKLEKEVKLASKHLIFVETLYFFVMNQLWNFKSQKPIKRTKLNNKPENISMAANSFAGFTAQHQKEKTGWLFMHIAEIGKRKHPSKKKIYMFGEP